MSVEKAIQVGSIMSARVLRVWLLINVLRGHIRVQGTITQLCGGIIDVTKVGTFGTRSIMLNVDTAKCDRRETPRYFTTLQARHVFGGFGTLLGTRSIVSSTATNFTTVLMQPWSNAAHLRRLARRDGWRIAWLAAAGPDTGSAKLRYIGAPGASLDQNHLCARVSLGRARSAVPRVLLAVAGKRMAWLAQGVDTAISVRNSGFSVCAWSGARSRVHDAWSWTISWVAVRSDDLFDHEFADDAKRVQWQRAAPHEFAIPTLEMYIPAVSNAVAGILATISAPAGFEHRYPAALVVEHVAAGGFRLLASSPLALQCTPNCSQWLANWTVSWVGTRGYANYISRCKAGAHRPTTHDAVCVACDAGMYGQGRRCHACRPGQYAAARGSVVCSACPAGRFSAGGATSKLCDGACAAGRWGRAGNATNSNCTGPCAAGRYSQGGSVSPLCDTLARWCRSTNTPQSCTRTGYVRLLLRRQLSFGSRQRKLIATAVQHAIGPGCGQVVIRQWSIIRNVVNVSDGMARIDISADIRFVWDTAVCTTHATPRILSCTTMHSIAKVLARMRRARFRRRAKALFRRSGLSPLAGMQILSPGIHQHSVPPNALWSSAPMMYALGRPARLAATMRSGLTPLAQPKKHTFWRVVTWLRQRTKSLDLVKVWLGAAGLLLMLHFTLLALRYIYTVLWQIGYQKGNHGHPSTSETTVVSQRNDTDNELLPAPQQQNVHHQYQDYEI